MLRSVGVVKTPVELGAGTLEAVMQCQPWLTARRPLDQQALGVAGVHRMQKLVQVKCVGLRRIRRDQPECNRVPVPSLLAAWLGKSADPGASRTL